MKGKPFLFISSEIDRQTSFVLNDGFVNFSAWNVCNSIRYPVAALDHTELWLRLALGASALPSPAKN